jgi:DNA repair protein RecN (Recombination protein N)
MLKQLYIKNYTLIEELDITFDSGFSVITGETGAGKSIILGAISLLLGQRADSKQVKNGAAKCTIEAHFDLSRYDFQPFFTENDIDYDEGDCILRRELTATGKSRAFINDTPVALTQMRELGEQLVDIHSQHQNLLLQKEDFQLNVVDIIADDRKQVDAYREAFHKYRTLISELEALRSSIEQGKRDEEYLRFQYQELTEAQLQDGQQEELEQESEMLSHAEEIKSALYAADQQLSGDEQNIVQSLRQVEQQLNGIEDVYPQAREMTERLASLHIELKDVAQEISSQMDNVEFNPARLETINTQLDTIYRLQQKFHVETIAELLTLQEQLATQLEQIDNSDEELAEREATVKKQAERCLKLAEELTRLRKKAATTIQKEMEKRLVPLGIPNVRFEISFKEQGDMSAEQLTERGADKIQFLFSANKSTPLQSLSQVASGGEIARVMLSLKAMISGAVKLPTIIFDEIDTGVSGKIAQKMALIMQEMGDQDRQVISITHLPQIAALGKHHYKVYKKDSADGTHSHMQQLTAEERVTEIAQMLSGDSVSEAALNNARELLLQNS